MCVSIYLPSTLLFFFFFLVLVSIYLPSTLLCKVLHSIVNLFERFDVFNAFTIEITKITIFFCLRFAKYTLTPRIINFNICWSHVSYQIPFER